MLGEYFFKKNFRKNRIECVVQLNHLPSLKNISDVFKQINFSNDIQAEIVDSQLICSFYSEYCLKKMDILQRRLRDAGFIEKYTNGLSFDFYNSVGERILLENNYSEPVKQYLASEFLEISKLLSDESSYTAILEVACGNARNIEIAHKHNLNYYGIDFIPKNIEQAEEKIKTLYKNTCSAVKCISIFDLDERTTFIPKHNKVLTVFPFNALGNMGSLISVLKIMLNLHYDIVFSVFKTTDEANHARFKYYKNCGYSDLQCHEDENGITFTSSEGLKTIAYSHHYLKSLIEVLNCKWELISSSNIGALYYLKF